MTNSKVRVHGPVVAFSDVNVNGPSSARIAFLKFTEEVPRISQRMDAGQRSPVGICRLCAYPPCLRFVFYH